MANEKWFSIDGIATAAHTDETRKVWTTWIEKSYEGRRALIAFAISEGFEDNIEEDLICSGKLAWEFILNKFQFSTKSNLLRHAITKFSS